MYKDLCVAALCCGIACCDVATGMNPDNVRELADSLSKVSTVGERLAVVAESSKPESSLQQDYKRIGELYKQLNGTPEFEQWCKDHPIYAGWLKLLDWLGQ